MILSHLFGDDCCDVWGKVAGIDVGYPPGRVCDILVGVTALCCILLTVAARAAAGKLFRAPDMPILPSK